MMKLPLMFGTPSRPRLRRGVATALQPGCNGARRPVSYRPVEADGAARAAALLAELV
jgi:hypothetical protein